MSERDLSQEFEKVIEWLELKEPLSIFERRSLRLSFDTVANGESALMVVSSGKKDVTVSISGAFCRDVPKNQKNWFKKIPDNSVGVSLKRDGLFLMSFPNDQDLFQSLQQIQSFEVGFLIAPEDKRFEF